MSNIQESAAQIVMEREEDSLFFKAIDHFDKMATELGMDSVWSLHIGNGLMKKDELVLEDKQYKVTYKYIMPDATMGDLANDTCWAEVSMFAPSGSVEHLWFAANSCIRQSGTHHRYIEDFEMQADGSLALVTGS